MNKVRRLMMYAGVCSLLLLLGAVNKPAQNDTFTHTVAKGESVSLLCIQYYGYYSDKLALALQKDNPALTDVNVITVGQELVLHTPKKAQDSATAATTPQKAPATAAESTAVLFEENVSATQGVVTYVEGVATLQPKGSKVKQKLTANVMVYPGDLLETANGRVELIINRESVVRLRENTRLTVAALRDNDGGRGKTRLGFSAGSVWTKMRKFKDKFSRFELQLPTAIAGVHGTVYQTTVNPDSSAEVKVFNGEVAVRNRPTAPSGSGAVGEVSGPGEVQGPQEVSMEQWTRIVRDMQRLTVDKKGKPGESQSFNRNPKDNWEQWNEERDHRIADMFKETH